VALFTHNLMLDFIQLPSFLAFRNRLKLKNWKSRLF